MCVVVFFGKQEGILVGENEVRRTSIQKKQLL